MAMEGDGRPVAWVTSVDVPDPGRAWSALSDLRGRTGLVPVLLDGQEDEEDYFFFAPASVAEIDQLDAATVLTELWDGEHQDTSDPAVFWDAPLSMEFPAWTSRRRAGTACLTSPPQSSTWRWTRPPTRNWSG
jgi:hypothetical protein